jgi:hypothetical protein
MAVQTQIQTRRGTAASWTSTNPTLAAGEIGFETDTGKFKIGNGSTAWASLAYATNGAVVSPLTTKGDLFTYSTTNARLAVGANGETLVADSSTSTGLRYQGSMAAGKNYVINGAMDFWQRGTSSTSAGYTAADRYYNSLVGTTTVSQSTDVPTNSNAQYSLKWLTGASSSYAAVLQALESAVVKPLRNQPMVLSFYVKTAGSYAGNILANVTYSNSTDALASVATSVTTAGDTSFAGSSVTSWTRKSITFTVPSDAVGLRFELTTNTAQASGVSFFVTSIQLETGSVATQFSRAGATIQGELAACQRYYWRGINNGAYTFYGNGGAISTTAVESIFPLPVTMRIQPTTVDFSTLAVQPIGGGTITAVTAVTSSAGTQSATFLVLTVASGLTSGSAYRFVTNNSTSGYLGLSAEL